MKKDKQIEELFNNYADELPQRDLCGKARAAASSGKRKQPVRRNNWIHLAWIVPAICVLLVAVVLFNTPLFGGPDHNGGPDTNGQIHDQNAGVPEEYTFYALSDVVGRRINLEQCDEVLNISAISCDEFNVTSVKCYAFYTSDGDLRYYKAIIGVRSAEGEFTELVLVAERDGFVRKDLVDVYDESSDIGGMVLHSDIAENGEYVTYGFFSARNFHFYAEGINGQYSNTPKYILNKIL